jgi:hypothetical protein
MSTVTGGQGNIVTNGLILNLDAANPRSYPQPYNGVTWTDLSRNNNNGTLVNTPTFSSNIVGGNFTFNGTNQYVSCGNSASLQITVGTISAWFKATSGNSSFRGIVVKQNAWGLFLYDNVLIAFDWGNYLATAPVFNINAGIRSTGLNLGTNIWTNVTMTFSETIGTVLPGPPNNNVIIYVNGLPVLTTTTLNSAQTTPVQFGWGNFSGQFLVGSIAKGLIYNRVLTSTEVLQNHNATRARFGV